MNQIKSYTFAPVLLINYFVFMNIYVGSLHYDVNEADLRGFFEEYGQVASCRVITDKYTGRSKGFGFVEMPNADEANRAIEELNGAEVNGRAMVVNESQERKEGGGDRGGRRNFGGGSGGGGERRGGGGGGYKPRY